ncbi:MAG TPA: FAD:protein FMN transferase, partial [Parafilimonas sp.]|nr:FAD:protein FMN transferase [Parafilimonas sp.]
SNKISQLTQGAFDITYGSVDTRLWNFDTNMTSLPDKETAKKMVRLINYNNVILDEKSCTVFLKEKGMRIGFGGIGKGYAAEMAKHLLKHNGVESGVVNAAGDLTAWGNQPNGKPWTIGIANPDTKYSAFSHLNITNVSVATSGNYEKFAIINGKKYSHTIDPKTGLPVSGIKSVTIICTNAEVADAMATPVMIMGIKTGLDMINQMKDIACIIIDDDNKIHTSENIHLT